VVPRAGAPQREDPRTLGGIWVALGGWTQARRAPVTASLFGEGLAMLQHCDPGRQPNSKSPAPPVSNLDFSISTSDWRSLDMLPIELYSNCASIQQYYGSY